MKRSEINNAIRWAADLMKAYHISLPEYAGWSVEQWKHRAPETALIRQLMLGWDITDFGCGDFDRIGTVLYTVRNGSDTDPGAGVPYCEKYLIMKEGQRLPKHYHVSKTEDIINRGGGNVLIRVYNSLPDEEIDYEPPVVVHKDGCEMTVPAGTQVKLTPGESIHIYQGMYHDFSVEPGTGAVLMGEVSQCNDDNNDNRFNPPSGRFPAIDEDEPPYRLLCNEYPAAK